MKFTNLLTPFIKFNFTQPKNQGRAFDGFVYILSAEKFKKYKSAVQQIVETHAHSSHQKVILDNPKKTIHFMGIFGPVWILFANEIQNSKSQGGFFNESVYGWMRDQAGGLISQMKSAKVQNISVDLSAFSESAVRGFVVGAELATYNYLQMVQLKIEKNLEITIKASVKLKSDAMTKIIFEAQKTAQAINLARHLVNMPPNEVNPASVEQLIKKELPFSKTSTIEVWDYEKCKKENLNLLVAVGQGAKHKPRLIRIKYRPATTSAAKNKKPIAFVGKGITFDTGGLDLKPSSGMRLMKKDMGGSAAVLGLAIWVDAIKYKRPCDFYLALAENSVDSESMRPSDVYKSRAGYLVEIDNTDAEGRLVLADAMDVAVTRTEKDKPEYLIDVATLTGAIKVALGADVAGLFCNDEKLSEQIMKAGQVSAEPHWRMPLIQKYASSLNSNFADFRNSADGFGGAITAALFLEKFVQKTKWAHLDVYCWTDKSTGALSAGAANGQPVQSLISWLRMVE